MRLDPIDRARLLGSPGPILCVDTCSVLDIFRDPTREIFKADDVQAALKLVDAFADGRAHCLVAEQVRTEFAEHVDRIQREADQALAGLHRRLAHVHGLASALGATGALNLSALHELTQRGRALSQKLMDGGIALATTEEVVNRAYTRMVEPRTPARRGKDSMKDCVVIETYLDAVAELRAAGHIEPVVFVSSNVTDYTGEGHRKLPADLAAEFARSNIEFAPNLPAAQYFLGV